MKILIFFFLLLNGVKLYAMDETQAKLKIYLEKLVSFKTFSEDHQANLQALGWVEDQLRHLNLNATYHNFEGYPALTLTVHPTKKPTIWLVAHMDVVSAPHELFIPRYEGNKMFGRGTYDMKMAIACYLLLMEELKDKKLNVGIMLTSDEEIGGMHGVKKLLEEGYASEFALLPDGGFNWAFEEEAKGVLMLQLTTKGKSAHSSRPWEGENAIFRLFKALESIQKTFDDKKENDTYFPTINLGYIQGGHSINQVPDYAEAKIDIRYPSRLNAERLLEGLKKAFINIQFTKVAEGSPHFVDTGHSFFLLFKEIARRKYGIEIGKVRSHGASDARYFGERNIPVMVIAPRGGEIHSLEEWVDLEDLVKFYEVIKEWICFAIDSEV